MKKVGVKVEYRRYEHAGHGLGPVSVLMLRDGLIMRWIFGNDRWPINLMFLNKEMFKSSCFKRAHKINTMKILILGAAGQIARTLTNYLLEQTNHELVLYARNST